MSPGMRPGHLIWVEDLPKTRLQLRMPKHMGVVMHVGDTVMVVQRLLENGGARDEAPVHLLYDSPRLRILRPNERADWHARVRAHGTMLAYEPVCFGTQL